MLAILTSRLGLAGIALALVLGVFGIQALRLAHAKSDLKAAQASLGTCRSSLSTANASIQAQADRGKAAMEGASKAVAAVTPKAQHIASHASVLASHQIKGETEIDRWRDAEAAVRGSLK